MRDTRERLLDMLDSIERIDKYAVRGQEAFEKDELIQPWIVHHLQVIGAAASKLSADITNRHPEVPWRDIIGMRQILVHDYIGVDLGIVWNVVSSHLPPLKTQIQRLLLVYPGVA